mmetsp:Transcript_11477/g.12785  ORF Transcript_11477/g.12785 Transcript_11477/m.12785 type:complete len:349 (+) Transcript_11477:69-1115(+)
MGELKMKTSEIEDMVSHIDDDNDNDDDDDMMLFAAAAKWAETKEEEHMDQDEAVKESSKTEKKRKKKKKKKDSKDGNTDIMKSSPSKQGDTIRREQSHVPLSAPAALLNTSIFQSKPNKKYSLHVTNLPYETTKSEILEVFKEKGCIVTSARLVMNYHKKHTYQQDKIDKSDKKKDENSFTGVAFVDMIDESSYDKALQMDKTVWTSPKDDKNDEKNKDSNKNVHWRYGRNRRINVRPTRTREELANIVQRTKEKVENQRLKQKQLRQELSDGKGKSKNEVTSTMKKRKHSKSDEKDDKSDSEKKRNRDKDGGSKKNKKHGKGSKNDIKLIKKERNKKAAIIMSGRKK